MLSDSYGLSQYTFSAGNFSEDARGRWYFNIVVGVAELRSTGTGAVGLDLGCKEAVKDSNGEGVTGREYRKLEQKLGTAQRARNKKQVKAIQAKIKMAYKCDHAGIVFKEVNEANTTVTCSVCKKHTGPKGLESLRIRGWRCEACGTHHACRDTNSAINILAVGLDRLAGEKAPA